VQGVVKTQPRTSPWLDSSTRAAKNGTQTANDVGGAEQSFEPEAEVAPGLRVPSKFVPMADESNE